MFDAERARRQLLDVANQSRQTRRRRGGASKHSNPACWEIAATGLGSVGQSDPSPDEGVGKSVGREGITGDLGKGSFM
jgi:hypothetical protein